MSHRGLRSGAAVGVRFGVTFGVRAGAGAAAPEDERHGREDRQPATAAVATAAAGEGRFVRSGRLTSGTA
jgi:hypothetical protein